MSSTTNSYGASATAAHTIDHAYDEEIERVHQVSNVKSDIDFVSIFANLIRKMDDGAQAAL